MRRLWLIFTQAVTVAVAVLFVIATLKPDWLRRGGPTTITDVVSLIEAAPSEPPASGVPNSYAPAARRATPAVVSITASRAPVRDPRTEDPWFRFFFGERSMPQRQQMGIGSGVIASPEGYLLTNNHVVDGADDIEVLLSDGRSARARIVGTDPESDLAVLKVDLDRLPAIAFSDSDKLEVGDVVLAIGNPFGIGQTVTSGIVSALGRNQLDINTFENFIQTDAAINPGNSGGALVDASGNLIGINTAIYSRSGGNMGIGFAIPSAVARQVLESLVRDGEVVRGYIGVETRDLTPEIAETFHVPTRAGVFISGVVQNGPAHEGGVRPGDVVTKVGEQAVANPRELLNAVSALRPRSSAPIEVVRAGRTMELNVTVAQRPRRDPTRQQ